MKLMAITLSVLFGSVVLWREEGVLYACLFLIPLHVSAAVLRWSQRDPSA